MIALEKKKRIVVDNVERRSRWLANLAALTLHSWSSRAPHLDRPDYVILDLDPGDGTWADVIDVARAVRTLLDALSLESAVKTSGKRGIHIVVPIAEGPSHQEATAFARAPRARRREGAAEDRHGAPHEREARRPPVRRLPAERRGERRSSRPTRSAPSTARRSRRRSHGAK